MRSTIDRRPRRSGKTRDSIQEALDAAKDKNKKILLITKSEGLEKRIIRQNIKKVPVNLVISNLDFIELFVAMDFDLIVGDEVTLDDIRTLLPYTRNLSLRYTPK